MEEFSGSIFYFRAFKVANSGRAAVLQQCLKALVPNLSRRFCVEESKETMLKCPFCSCHFCTETDLKKHMDAFGTEQQEHLYRLRETHRRIEQYSSGWRRMTVFGMPDVVVASEFIAALEPWNVFRLRKTRDKMSIQSQTIGERQNDLRQNEMLRPWFMRKHLSKRFHFITSPNR